MISSPVFYYQFRPKSGSKRASDVLHWINTWIPRAFWSIVQEEIVKVLALKMFHPAKRVFSNFNFQSLELWIFLFVGPKGKHIMPNYHICENDQRRWNLP